MATPYLGAGLANAGSNFMTSYLNTKMTMEDRARQKQQEDLQNRRYDEQIARQNKQDAEHDVEKDVQAYGNADFMRSLGPARKDFIAGANAKRAQMGLTPLPDWAEPEQAPGKPPSTFDVRQYIAGTRYIDPTQQGGYLQAGSDLYGDLWPKNLTPGVQLTTAAPPVDPNIAQRGAWQTLNNPNWTPDQINPAIQTGNAYTQPTPQGTPPTNLNGIFNMPIGNTPAAPVIPGKTLGMMRNDTTLRGQDKVSKDKAEGRKVTIRGQDINNQNADDRLAGAIAKGIVRASGGGGGGRRSRGGSGSGGGRTAGKDSPKTPLEKGSSPEEARDLRALGFKPNVAWLHARRVKDSLIRRGYLATYAGNYMPAGKGANRERHQVYIDEMVADTNAQYDGAAPKPTPTTTPPPPKKHKGQYGELQDLEDQVRGKIPANIKGEDKEVWDSMASGFTDADIVDGLVRRGWSLKGAKAKVKWIRSQRKRAVK